ncbi:ammonium transporter [Pyruvatibacter sp. HU-CL02332]|uniref:ammonium transporter n=1 Tax=Pyruvatibacter sp. HU-CL02332 TaxID=3127650 RepID=UPI0029688F2E|nr:ammonium transporter [Alphaproteobacteria bacterium]
MGDPAITDNTIWLLVCTVLVLLMQAGFTCLETGLVRAKNSINVAVKNVADFCVASLAFWAVGFGIMFGATAGGVFGTSFFFFDTGPFDGTGSAWLMAFFFFQLAFCGTATTIVSGAVAERMSFRGYLMTAVILSACIYPVFGHWAWGGFGIDTQMGWLQELGFIDFAGSTVVHSIGGWVALAAVIIIGPRLGQFDESNSATESHNTPVAVFGMFLLWVGWFGFNGGSTLAMDVSVPHIMVHTLIAAAAGGVTAMALTWNSRGAPNAVDSLNGVLAGLVAITASAHVATIGASILIGGIGAVVALGCKALLQRYRIDDAVGAVPVHLAAGIWGTLAVALVGDASLWGTGYTRLEQFGVQALGVTVAGIYAFGVGYAVLSLINWFMPLRVTAEAEHMGLNASEHGASTAIHDLIHAMDTQKQTGDFSMRVPVEPYTEAGQIAAQYNQVLDRVHGEMTAREQTSAQLRTARDQAEIANAAKSQFLANMSHELRTPLNAIIGFSEIINGELFGPLGNEQYKEYVSDIHDSGSHLLSIINDILDLSKIEADSYDLAEDELNVRDVMTACERMIRTRAQSGQLNLAVEIEPDLPALVADERALKQMLINLVSNAVKFTPEGGDIALRARLEADGRIAIEVADTGVGIARSDIAKAFEPFAQLQADATVFKADGTGLGLPLTAALARSHQATLVVDSEPGRGTAITIRFPLERIVVNKTAAA